VCGVRSAPSLLPAQTSSTSMPTLTTKKTLPSAGLLTPTKKCSTPRPSKQGKNTNHCPKFSVHFAKKHLHTATICISTPTVTIWKRLKKIGSTIRLTNSSTRMPGRSTTKTEFGASFVRKNCTTLWYRTQTNNTTISSHRSGPTVRSVTCTSPRPRACTVTSWSSTSC
jgi:hypothetical protein